MWVSIMKDRNTGKFCFVNLTSSHVCKCRFDTFGDAIEDLMTREEVEYFDIHYAKDPIIERKKEWCLNNPDMEIEADEMHENVIKEISEKMKKNELIIVQY